MGNPSPGRKPRVLFVCVENAGRSQMAEGFARHLAGIAIEAASAGSRPAGQLNPAAVEAMLERGVDISGHKSKGFGDLPDGPWDYVVTMGCGDACPFVPGRQRLDWDLPDPKGQGIETVRAIRDRIEGEVRRLITRILWEQATSHLA